MTTETDKPAPQFMLTTITIEHTVGEQVFQRRIDLDGISAGKVLFDFNPTADERTTVLNALCAGAIKMMLDHQATERAKPTSDPEANNIKQARMRAAAVAMTHVETAQMWLVKSLFAKA